MNRVTILCATVAAAGVAIGVGTARATDHIDANGVSHGFVRSRHGRITTYDVPGAQGQGLAKAPFLHRQ